MKLVEIRGEAEFNQLRAAWNQLACEGASQSIFVTWEWAAAWWFAYGKPGDLRILTVFDDNGVLVGIAPLRHQRLHRYGQTVSALSFVGDGSIGSDYNDSDYLDFIVAPGYEKPVMEAIHRYWKDELDSGVVLLLHEMPEASPNLAALKELAESRGMHWSETSAPCATVSLPGDWEDYLHMLQPRFRTKVRSVLRNLESRPEIRFGFCDDVRHSDRLLPSLFDLHTRRWARDGKPGVFGGNAKRDFYLRLSRLLEERRWLRFSYLEWNGKVLACQYGFAYNKTYSQLQEGYEPASEHWNLGVALRAWSIREFLKEGLAEYDFLGGINRHKTDWGAKIKFSKRILLTGKSSRNALFRRGPEWETIVRESLRKVLPQKVLEARRKMLEGQTTGTREWVRRVAADCYFHSGLPALARSVRKRYQLSLAANGDRRKPSWNKRVAGSARILYYHRVNNDKDAFFDAISPQLFEEQMQYLARHHKVASISEILHHLEEGKSPETLVGVTFDDGYCDNYENAFPILQRYGLPATVFLTTGSIDSGEPLWFERLAEAFKKTTREFLDLDLDIPRRLWMRTEQERFESNHQLFLWLRSLENTDRKRWLADILKQLGVIPQSERGNKMLTWEQIRLMKANGIDFGGHTVTHPFLSKLVPSEAAWEISECKRRIEEELQQPALYFAYPNGREEDFGASSRELVRAAGYEAAMTTIWGMNYQSTDRMQLKRGGPWEKSPALFAYKLDWYQLVNE